MSNVFVLATVISFAFFIIKFIEMRFIEKENKPLKLLIRDTLFVYFSVIAGDFIVQQLKPIIAQSGGELGTGGATKVFVDNPGF
jgi:hypothetical protein